MILGNDLRQKGFDFGQWTEVIIKGMIYREIKIKVGGFTTAGSMQHELGTSFQKQLKVGY